jgi:hypothetical protein
MLRCCIVCKAGASPDRQLQYCAVCQSALYCSKACQRKDWKEQHKKICKRVNVGHGDRQFRSDIHTSRSIRSKEQFEGNDRIVDENEDGKLFFKLFTESTFEGSRAAARKMKEIAKRQTKQNQKFKLFHSLYFLIHHPNSEMLSWPNSPLLVMLQFVDSNVMSGDDNAALQGRGETPLHHISSLADPFDYSTHVNQLILAKQLIEHGADVNAVSNQWGQTPLHDACYSGVVTNLDLIKFLLEAGADPNLHDHRGMIPLMYTFPDAPGAAKFLLNWPTTDVDVTTQSGVLILGLVRSLITAISDGISDGIATPENPEYVNLPLMLQQWCAIEEMLVERGPRIRDHSN